MNHGERLAEWILARASVPISALKLQKLLFYTYGAALAHDLEGPVGDVSFHAWKHGPVSIPVYERYKAHRANVLPRPFALAYPNDTEEVLRDALTVYECLSPWQLREESHLEDPWRLAAEGSEIEPMALKHHFKRKFRCGSVRPPEHLGAWSLQLDRIPVRGYPTLHDLATAVRPSG